MPLVRDTGPCTLSLSTLAWPGVFCSLCLPLPAVLGTQLKALYLLWLSLVTYHPLSSEHYLYLFSLFLLASFQVSRIKHILTRLHSFHPGRSPGIWPGLSQLSPSCCRSFSPGSLTVCSQRGSQREPESLHVALTQSSKQQCSG